MRRFLSSPVPMWVLLLVALFSLIVIGGVAGSKDAEKQSAATTTTTSTSTTTTSTSTTTTLPVRTEPITVLDISGKNKTNSDSFSVVSKWTMHAEVSGGAGVIVSIHDTITDQVVDHIDFSPPGGDSAFHSACICYLELEPFGSSFHITVTDDPG